MGAGLDGEDRKAWKEAGSQALESDCTLASQLLHLVPMEGGDPVFLLNKFRIKTA